MRTFAALAPGGWFEIRVDHDPKPLHYQLAAEQPGTLTWDDVEQGPELWQVRLGRMASPPDVREPSRRRARLGGR